MSTIPAIRHYTDKHVFEHVYRNSNGQLRIPKFLGAVVFPNGKSWSLYSIKGAQYIIESYSSKVFKSLSIESIFSNGGVILLHDKPIAFHCYFRPGTLSHQEIQELINDGSIVVIKPVTNFKD